MACLEMYNNSTPSNSHQQPSASPPMSPRISFSNDFVESHNNNNNNNNLLLNTSRSSSSSSSQTPAASSDFEFSVSNYNMMSADELFFKGTILPFSFKDNNNNNTQMQSNRTLRDQLLVDDDHHDIFSLKPPKSSSSSSNGWKGFLGLRKSHIGSKKAEKIDSSFDSPKRFSFSHEDPNPKSSQGMVSNEGPSSTDMEMGV